MDSKLYAKYQNPSSSSSQDIMLTKFSVAMMAAKMGHNSVISPWNLLKILSDHLNIDPIAIAVLKILC